eukprot:31529-Eustigmatos_ZCMA.PRE.1
MASPRPAPHVANRVCARLCGRRTRGSDEEGCIGTYKATLNVRDSRTCNCEAQRRLGDDLCVHQHGVRA